MPRQPKQAIAEESGESDIELQVDAAPPVAKKQKVETAAQRAARTANLDKGRQALALKKEEQRVHSESLKIARQQAKDLQAQKQQRELARLQALVQQLQEEESESEESDTPPAPKKRAKKCVVEDSDDDDVRPARRPRKFPGRAAPPMQLPGPPMQYPIRFL